jgi:hypothetical protein
VTGGQKMGWAVKIKEWKVHLGGAEPKQLAPSWWTKGTAWIEPAGRQPVA